MGKSSGASQRPVTAEEQRLWDAQANQLDLMGQIAQDQYNISQEDRSYYEKIFREGSDTQAKEALAKLQEQITGNKVDPASIQSVNIDSLLRDTILAATPEFQQAASQYVAGAETLTKQYGSDVTGLSKSFADSLTGFTDKYSNEIQALKEATGTIDQGILSQETGAATAGISQAFAEARKQMGADLARRGLAGSGVEQTALGTSYQQEALAKGQAMTQARTSARGISEQIRSTQAGLAGSQLQAQTAGAQGAYQAQLGGIQNVYGVTSAQQLQNYNLQNAATLQGISGLTQIAQAGTGLYTGAQNYLAQSGATAGQAASIAGSSAAAMGNLNQQYAQMQQTAASSSAAGIGSLVGTLGAAYMSGGTSLLAQGATGKIG